MCFLKKLTDKEVYIYSWENFWTVTLRNELNKLQDWIEYLTNSMESLKIVCPNLVS